jgi:hypothetical protein
MSRGVIAPLFLLDHWWEVRFLQRGVYCEPDALDQVSRLAAAYNRGLNRAIREIGYQGKIDGLAH